LPRWPLALLANAALTMEAIYDGSKRISVTLITLQ
jgi:hypothetical protein